MPKLFFVQLDILNFSPFSMVHFVILYKEINIINMIIHEYTHVVKCKS